MIEYSAAYLLPLLYQNNSLALHACKGKSGWYRFDRRARPRSPSLLSPVSPVVRAATSRIATGRDRTNTSLRSTPSPTPPATTASATTAPATTRILELDPKHQAIHARAGCISARRACFPAPPGIAPSAPSPSACALSTSRRSASPPSTPEDGRVGKISWSTVLMAVGVSGCESTYLDNLRSVTRYECLINLYFEILSEKLP